MSPPLPPNLLSSFSWPYGYIYMAASRLSCSCEWRSGSHQALSNPRALWSWSWPWPWPWLWLRLGCGPGQEAKGMDVDACKNRVASARKRNRYVLQGQTGAPDFEGQKLSTISPQRCAKKKWPLGPVAGPGRVRAGPKVRHIFFIGTFCRARISEITPPAQK